VGEISGTYYFEMTSLVETVSWALKRAAKMKGRIVNELDVDICRLVMITFLVSTAGLSDVIHKS
jgi:hypothetical protein